MSHATPLLLVAVLMVTTGCGSLVAVSGLPTCVTPGPASVADHFNETVSLTTASNGLKYGDLKVGCGAVPRKGQTVTIEYTGWLTDGTTFDTSRSPSRTPFQFPYDTGVVIPGVDQGMAGMRVGGRRRIVIPPSLGYGAQGAAPVIPPNATLIFDVELVGISG